MDGYMDKMIRKKGRREAEKNEFTCFPPPRKKESLPQCSLKITD
jgi:hypothetical protein